MNRIQRILAVVAVFGAVMACVSEMSTPVHASFVDTAAGSIEITVGTWNTPAEENIPLEDSEQVLDGPSDTSPPLLQEAVVLESEPLPPEEPQAPAVPAPGLPASTPVEQVQSSTEPVDLAPAPSPEPSEGVINEPVAVDPLVCPEPPQNVVLVPTPDNPCGIVGGDIATSAQ